MVSVVGRNTHIESQLISFVCERNLPLSLTHFMELYEDIGSDMKALNEVKLDRTAAIYKVVDSYIEYSSSGDYFFNHGQFKAISSNLRQVKLTVYFHFRPFKRDNRGYNFVFCVLGLGAFGSFVANINVPLTGVFGSTTNAISRCLEGGWCPPPPPAQDCQHC